LIFVGAINFTLAATAVAELKELWLEAQGKPEYRVLVMADMIIPLITLTRRCNDQ